MPLGGVDGLRSLAEGVQALVARVTEPTHVQTQAAETGARLTVPQLIYAEPVQLLQTEVRRLVSEFEKRFEASRRAVETCSVWQRGRVLRCGRGRP